LDGGLYSLQQLATLILYVCTYDEAAIDRTSKRLKSLELSFAHVQDVIEDIITNMEDTVTLVDEDEEEEIVLDDLSEDGDPESSRASNNKQKLQDNPNLVKRTISDWFSSFPGFNSENE
jgi:hypothetical protein